MSPSRDLRLWPMTAENQLIDLIIGPKLRFIKADTARAFGTDETVYRCCHRCTRTYTRTLFRFESEIALVLRLLQQIQHIRAGQDRFKGESRSLSNQRFPKLIGVDCRFQIDDASLSSVLNVDTFDPRGLGKRGLPRAGWASKYHDLRLLIRHRSSSHLGIPSMPAYAVRRTLQPGFRSFE